MIKGAFIFYDITERVFFRRVQNEFSEAQGVSSGGRDELRPSELSELLNPPEKNSPLKVKKKSAKKADTTEAKKRLP